jgi:hypothetical protein
MGTWTKKRKRTTGALAAVPKSSESDIQEALVQQLRTLAKLGVLPDGFVFWAVPNELGALVAGSLSSVGIPKAAAIRAVAICVAKLKRCGMLKGAPDLVFFYGGKAMCIEMKTSTGRTSEDQNAVHEALIRGNTPVYICRSYNEALTTIQAWLLSDHNLSVTL